MKALIKIHIKPWSGWSAAQPPASEFTAEFAEGDVLGEKLPGGMNAGKISIKSIDAQQVIFQIWGLAPQQPDGRIDIFGSEDGEERPVKKGEQMMLGTLTTDAGTSYTVSVLELQP